MAPLRIVSLASEAAPWAKTGGLGDVAGALARALAARGHELHLILPLYAAIDRERHGLKSSGFRVEATLPTGRESFEVFEAPGKSPRTWFLSHPSFDRPGLYGPGAGDYPDNHLRFGSFCRAALELVRRECPGPDVLHLHDWQAALAAVELRAPGLARDASFARTKVAFTIHNLGYTGSFGPEALDELGLPASLWAPEALEFYGRLALIKGGLVWADALTTVSPRYSREICTPAFGGGLDGLLRARVDRLSGILNGIDVSEWDPTRDPHLPARYSADDPRGKIACKGALQRELGLDPDRTALLFGVVSRLVWQKGIDLVAELAESIAARGGQLAILGVGEPELERRLAELSWRLPRRIAFRRAFDEALAHRIVAGSDAVLMPSRYEPCGLTQLHAQRYGTVPVVRASGGLDDTVRELDSARGSGTGFKFGAATASACWAAVGRAIEAWRDPAVWTGLAVRGMKQDFSWDASAAAYEQLFLEPLPDSAEPERARL